MGRGACAAGLWERVPGFRGVEGGVWGTGSTSESSLSKPVSGLSSAGSPLPPAMGAMGSRVGRASWQCLFRLGSLEVRVRATPFSHADTRLSMERVLGSLQRESESLVG